MDHPHQQQISGLATVVGVLIGILRAKDVINADEQQTLFVFAGSMLPDTSAGFGDQIMSVIRNAAHAVDGG